MLRLRQVTLGPENIWSQLGTEHTGKLFIGSRIISVSLLQQVTLGYFPGSVHGEGSSRNSLENLCEISSRAARFMLADFSEMGSSLAQSWLFRLVEILDSARFCEGTQYDAPQQDLQK